MANSAATVWEIQPGVGSANNGGGFVTGASGTDYSQQTAVQYALSGVTSSGAGSTVLTASAASDMVGNYGKVVSGTNFTVSRFQVISVVVGTSITFATNNAGTAITTGVGASGVINIGGCLASAVNIGVELTAGHILYEKATGTSDSLSGAVTAAISGTVTAPIIWEGYHTTRGDLFSLDYVSSHTTKGFIDTTNFPLIDAGTGGVLSGGVANWWIRCLNFTSAKTSTSIFIMGVACVTFRCKIASTANNAVHCFTGGLKCIVDDCDFTHVGTSGTFAIDTALLNNCRLTSTNGSGVTMASTAGSVIVIDSLFYDMAASQVAINQPNANQLTWVANCTFDNIVGTCITIPDVAQVSPMTIIEDNQVTNCGTFLNNLRSATQAIWFVSERNRIRDTSTSYTGWYTNTSNSDITTSQTDANEYVDRTNKDFHLKDGAKGQGGAWPSYLDTGCFQRKEPTLPVVADVRLSTRFGDNGTEFTGVLNLPVVADVRSGTTYDNATKTGTLVVPDIANVRSGVTFGSSSSLTGVLVLPLANQVQTAVGFGANGTEFTGSFSGSGGGNFPLGG